MYIPVSRVLPLRRPDEVDIQQAARYMGARGGPDASTRALLGAVGRALAGGRRAPRGLATRAGQRAGRAVAGQRHCAPPGRLQRGAVLLAVTLGPGVDAQIAGPGWGDVAAGAASDALASALTEQALIRPKPPCGRWPRRKGYTSPGATRRDTATGPSGCSPASPPCWTRHGGSAVRDRYLFDAAPQERHGGAGGQPGARDRGTAPAAPTASCGTSANTEERRDL